MTKVLFAFKGLHLLEQHFEAIHLALELREAGLDTQIGAQKLDCPLVDYLEWLGIDWVYMPDTPEFSSLPLWAQKKRINRIASDIKPFIEDHGIDIVHTHDSKDHLLWSLLERRINIKHVVHHRDSLTFKRSSRIICKSSLILIDQERKSALNKAWISKLDKVKILPHKISGTDSNNHDPSFSRDYLWSIGGEYAAVLPQTKTSSY